MHTELNHRDFAIMSNKPRASWHEISQD